MASTGTVLPKIDLSAEAMQARVEAARSSAGAPTLGAVNVPQPNVIRHNATGTLDQVARGLGTDRKTLLLVGVLGIVTGYALHSGLRSTRLALRRGAKRTRQLATPAQSRCPCGHRRRPRRCLLVL